MLWSVSCLTMTRWPGRKRLCFDWVSLMPEDAWGKGG
jgi:hypothetical protein